MREHGISGLQEVALGVLEVDGSISLLKYDDVRDGENHPKRLKFLKRQQ
jgi:uncharacterized membrane protein YcaP (DUF421 family)